jgi:hypothetical protein
MWNRIVGARVNSACLDLYLKDRVLDIFIFIEDFLSFSFFNYREFGCILNFTLAIFSLFCVWLL